MQYFAEKTFEHTEIIWGDKTPNYLMYTGKLKETFRHAKFLHIIRDPRERSLSLRKAWHANIFKGAARWVDALNKYYQDRESFQQDCLDVQYEDLVKAPEMCITTVCHFLGIPFEKNVLILRRPVEVYGDNKANTQSIRKIVVNINKYLKELSENEVRRIEEITLPYLWRYNYPVHYVKYFRKLSKKEKLLYSLSDNFYGVVYHCRKWGLTKGLYFSYLRFRFNTMKSD